MYKNLIRFMLLGMSYKYNVLSIIITKVTMSLFGYPILLSYILLNNWYVIFASIDENEIWYNFLLFQLFRD